ncbi:MAG: VOC family protein [Anaerolineaceae bacterium]
MLKQVDCVMLKVEDVDAAITFYRDVMGLAPLWRAGEMAGLGFPDVIARGESMPELVLHSDSRIPQVDVNYKVDDVIAETARLAEAGCQLLAGPFPIAIGNCAVILDPFGNSLTLVDMTIGPRQNNLA